MCFKQTLQKLYFANMDKMKCAALDHFDLTAEACLVELDESRRFFNAKIEDVKSLSEFEAIEPVFLLYNKDGKREFTFEGVDGPGIEAAMRKMNE